MDPYALGYNATSFDMPLNQKVFLASFDAIKKVADEGPCIIVGRCADYALKDYDNKLNVFVHAPMSFKKSRIQEQYEICLLYTSGSCLGLYTYIVEQYPEKQVTLLLEPVQEKFSFLKYADQITQKKESTEPYDLFFSLDCSDTERLHEFKKYFEEAKYKICVDHHFTNQGFGDLQFIVPDASSTCEVLFSMFDWEKISLACAQDL